MEQVTIEITSLQEQVTVTTVETIEDVTLTIEPIIEDVTVTVVTLDSRQPASLSLNGAGVLAASVPSDAVFDVQVLGSDDSPIGVIESDALVRVDSISVVENADFNDPNLLAALEGNVTYTPAVGTVTVKYADDTVLEVKEVASGGVGTVVVPQPIIYSRPQWGVQTVSFAAGDAYDQRLNLYDRAQSMGINQSIDWAALNPIKTLKYNSVEFGTKERFTNDAGVDVYGDGGVSKIRYDHLQGIIFDATDFIDDNRRSFADAWTLCQAKTEVLNGKTYLNWYLMPIEYALNLVDEQLGGVEPRLGNTVGVGILFQTSTFCTDEVNMMYIRNSAGAGTDPIAVASGEFNFIPMAFIEDYQ